MAGPPVHHVCTDLSNFQQTQEHLTAVNTSVGKHFHFNTYKDTVK